MQAMIAVYQIEELKPGQSPLLPGAYYATIARRVANGKSREDWADLSNVARKNWISFAKNYLYKGSSIAQAWSESLAGPDSVCFEKLTNRQQSEILRAANAMLEAKKKADGEDEATWATDYRAIAAYGSFEKSIHGDETFVDWNGLNSSRQGAWSQFVLAQSENASVSYAYRAYQAQAREYNSPETFLALSDEVKAAFQGGAPRRVRERTTAVRHDASKSLGILCGSGS